MKKYNLSAIMKRAWEIKKESDRKVRNQLYNLYIFRDLEDSEKAVFSECLKMAWAEAKKAERIAEKYNVSIENAFKMARTETILTLEYDGTVSWKIWKNYGKYRAYYTVSTRSRYANSKKDNYIILAA